MDKLPRDVQEMIANRLPVKALCVLRQVNHQWRNIIATMKWEKPQCVVVNLRPALELVRWTIFFSQFSDDQAMLAAITIGGLPLVRFRIDTRYEAKVLFLRRFPNVPLHELTFEKPIDPWLYYDALYMRCQSSTIHAEDPFPTNVDGITFQSCYLDMQYFARILPVRKFVRLEYCWTEVTILGIIEMRCTGTYWTLIIKECPNKMLPALAPLWMQCDAIQITCVMREPVRLPGNARVRKIECYGDLQFEGDWPNLQTVTVERGSFDPPHGGAWNCRIQDGMFYQRIYERET